MQDNIHIIPLDHIDNVYVEELLDAAFGTDRHSRPAYALRQNTEQLDNLCFAAVHTDGLLMGTIQCWPVKITAKNDEAFADGVSLPIIMVRLRFTRIGKIRALDAHYLPLYLPRFTLLTPRPLC